MAPCGTLIRVMKLMLPILLCLLVSACTGYNYPVKDGGDGVYYAESPPIYTYVDGYFGFPYYGPYLWTWYHPVWYSPYWSNHYSWYRPYQICGLPYYVPSATFAGHAAPRPGKRAKVTDPAVSAPPATPILPIDLGQMALSPMNSRYSGKNPTFFSAGTKSRYAVKSGRSAYAAKYGTQSGYRTSASSRASSSPRSMRPSSRSQSIRQAPSRMVTTDDP